MSRRGPRRRSRRGRLPRRAAVSRLRAAHDIGGRPGRAPSPTARVRAGGDAPAGATPTGEPAWGRPRVLPRAQLDRGPTGTERQRAARLIFSWPPRPFSLATPGGRGLYGFTF